MKMRKTRKAAFKAVDHFRRLPEELLLDIFNRVVDLKSLCFCSLVSKYFTSVIAQVRTITITLPGTEAVTIKSCGKLFALLHKIHHIKSEQIHALLDMLSLQNMKLPVFLEKFSKLESIYVESNLTTKPDDSSLIMWKGQWGSMNKNVGIETFVALLPVSVSKKTECELVSQENNPGFNISQAKDCVRLSLGCFAEWLCLISMLVKSHSTLQSVTVADSKEQSKLVVKDEQLANLRSCLREGEWEDTMFESNMKVAWIPLLDLPSSGSIMRDVCLVMLSVPTKSFESGVYDDIMNWKFEEHENVLGEAVKEILKNHRDQIMTA